MKTLEITETIHPEPVKKSRFGKLRCIVLGHQWDDTAGSYGYADCPHCGHGGLDCTWDKRPGQGREAFFHKIWLVRTRLASAIKWHIIWPLKNRIDQWRGIDNIPF